jgi:hypothetical protein
MNRHKKHVSTVALSILAVGLLAIGIGASYQTDKPPYHFLRKHLRSKDIVHKSLGYKTSVAIYSFQADFNSICTEAAVELDSAGNTATDRQGISSRSFLSYETDRIKRGTIQIFDGVVVSEETPDESFEWVTAPGWVTVSLGHTKRSIWQRAKEFCGF